MKRVNPLILSALLLFSCSSGTSSTSAPAASTPEEESKVAIFPKHSRGSGCVGDPMPYYENGKMYVYYLEDARNYGAGGYHPISLLETSDFTHYEDKGIMLDFVNDRYNIEFALATGSVVKDKQNKYHFFYGGYNDNKSFTGQPYSQTILHATSDDLYHWTKDPSFMGKGYIIGESDDFRDPYVFYMEEDNKYWMLVTSREGGTSTVLKYTSSDLLSWTKEGAFFKEGRFNNMECSSLVRFKGYWYYSFSENGEHGYTKFFCKKNLSDANWTEVPTLDGFYAGRPVIGPEGRLFLYGWVPTKGLYDLVKPDWAGNLLFSELTQSSDGMLHLSLAKEIKDAVNKETPYNFAMGGAPVSDFSLAKGSGISAKAIKHIHDNVTTRVSFDFTPDEKAGRAGITFANNGDNQLGTIAFDFNFTRGQFAFYNNVSGTNFGTPEYFVSYAFEAGKSYHIDLVTEDMVTLVYINDEACLPMRTASIQRNHWALYAQNTGVSFSNIKIYE